jgi:hypothetical protein
MNNLAIALFASASAFLFFAWLTMSLRMYVRITMIKAVGVDDYLIIAALVSILNIDGMVAQLCSYFSLFRSVCIWWNSYNARKKSLGAA